tara:strand:- start:1742 stop:1993 length:252 start_codon:yes stop_codon:yes gene_type:complete
MKVSELIVGMLVRTSSICGLSIVRAETPEGYNFFCDGKGNMMIYLGSKKSDILLHRSGKHHMFLRDNSVVAMSGYEIRHLEPV